MPGANRVPTPVLIDLTVAAAHLSYVLVERSFLRLGQRRQVHPGFTTELPPTVVEPA
jgi:peptidoglycan/LPS O-acetylase OafA/YrhL